MTSKFCGYSRGEGVLICLPCCFSRNKGRWLNHLELHDNHSVSVGVWCGFESNGFVVCKRQVGSLNSRDVAT